MNTDNILIMIFFIVPGVISEKLKNQWQRSKLKNTGDFKTIINGVINSLPISLISIYIYSKFIKEDLIKNILSTLYSVNNIIIFTLIVTLVMLSWTGLNICVSNTIVRKIKNHISEKRGSLKGLENNAWELFINNSDKFRFFEVISNGYMVKGFIKDYCIDDYCVMNLSIPETVYMYQDFNIDELFTDVIEIHVNPILNIVVKEYDTTKYYEWCQSKY